MLAHRSISTPRARRSPISFLRNILLLSTLMVLLLGLAGCGNKDEDGQANQNLIPEGDTLATVSGVKITSRDYKESLAKLQPAALPLDENGMTLDMASQSGKLAFLNTLIDDEALIAGAKKLGYEKDLMVIQAREKFMEGAANEMMSLDVIEKNSRAISEEELQAFVGKYGVTRECQFLMTNYEEQAIAARERALKGDPWQDIVKDYHDGIIPPSGKMVVNVMYGNEKAFFDTAVFAVGVGEVTETIQTGSGFWVLKVLRERAAPKFDVEANKPLLLGILQFRMKEKLHRDFREEVRALHELKINEETLIVAYNALDMHEMGRDETGKPKPVDELKPLAIGSKDLGRVLYSYLIDGKVLEFTLGEYKEHFDRMNGAKRPIYAGMIGGMRTKISEELEKQIITDEARIRGYFKNFEVIRMVDKLVNKMMIEQMLHQTLTFDNNVSPEVLTAFYEKNQNEYLIPETRDGLMVICHNEAKALEAIAMAESNMEWAILSRRYGTDNLLKSKGGKVSLTVDDPRPRAQALFGLKEQAEISRPFPVGDGRFGVTVLVERHVSRQAQYEEMTYKMAAMIRQDREVVARDEIVESMRADVVIEVFQDKLAALPSYDEAVSVEVPQNMVSGS